MRTVTSTAAKAQLNALLAEVVRSGETITITSHGKPIAALSPITPENRRFGLLPQLTVSEDFDSPLPASELDGWSE